MNSNTEYFSFFAILLIGITENKLDTAVKMYSHFASKSGKIYKRKECNECRGESEREKKKEETLKFAILLVH